MKKGYIFVVRTPGGGGYGDPLERDPKAVLKDVVNEVVSISSAREDYGVVIDSETKEINWEATRKLRERMLR